MSAEGDFAALLAYASDMLTLGLGHAEGKTITKVDVEPLDRRIAVRFDDGSAMLIYETCGSPSGLSLDSAGLFPKHAAWKAAAGSILRYVAFPSGLEVADNNNVFTVRICTSTCELDVPFSAPWEGLHQEESPEFRISHLPPGFDDFDLGSAFSTVPNQTGDLPAEPWAPVADEYRGDGYLQCGEHQEVTVYAFRRIEPFDATRAVEIAAWAATLEIRKAAEQHYGQPVSLDDRARLLFLAALRGPVAALADALPRPYWKPVGQRTFGRAESLELIKAHSPDVYSDLVEEGWV